MSDENADWVSNLERAAQQAAREFGAAFERAGRALGKAVEQAGRTSAAEAAMGAAFQADLNALEQVLRRMSPDEVREISAAAAVVTATADRILSQTPNHHEP